MASVGLDCDRLQPIPVWRDEAHHEASMGSASKPELGYPRGASVRFEKEKPPDLRDDRGLSYFASRRGRGGRGMPGWLALNLGSAEAFATPAGHQGFMAPPVVPAVVDRIG